MIEIRDKDNLKGKLRELAELRDLQEVVKINTSELQKKAMRKTSRFKKPTGNLKRSINMELKDGGLTGVVKAETDYAGYVEFGTRFMNSQPYLRPAMFEQSVQFRRDLFRIMK